MTVGEEVDMTNKKQSAGWLGDFALPSRCLFVRKTWLFWAAVSQGLARASAPPQAARGCAAGGSKFLAPASPGESRS